MSDLDEPEVTRKEIFLTLAQFLASSVFFLCWIPLAVLILWPDFLSLLEIEETFFIIANFAGILSSVICPVIFLSLLDLRKGLIGLCCGCFRSSSSYYINEPDQEEETETRF